MVSSAAAPAQMQVGHHAHVGDAGACLMVEPAGKRYGAIRQLRPLLGHAMPKVVPGRGKCAVEWNAQPAHVVHQVGTGPAQS